MNENGNGDYRGVQQLSEQIISLIFDRQYEQAAAMIDAARRTLSAAEMHRITALSAVLQNKSGNLRQSIELMRQAKIEKPTWLPHLYRLSVLLMDAERWFEADMTLDELISLSERNNEAYFLDEARFRKIVCLKALNRKSEILDQKAKISTGATVFIGDRLYGLDDV